MSEPLQLTVAEVVTKLVELGAADEALLAGQIRNWSRNGLYGALPTRGSGPTAPKVFDEQHVVMTRLFSILARLGMDVTHLNAVVRQLAKTPPELVTVGKANKVGLPRVIEAYKAGQTDWRFRLYADEWGNIKGGGMVRDETAHPTYRIIYPIHHTIEAPAIFGGLFTPTQPELPTEGGQR